MAYKHKTSQGYIIVENGKVVEQLGFCEPSEYKTAIRLESDNWVQS